MEDRRQKEREEDKATMKEVIKTELKDVVRKEIEEVMQPWKERTVRVEDGHVELGEEVRRLATEVRGLKDQVATQQKGRSFASVAGHGGAVTDVNAVPIGGDGSGAGGRGVVLRD